MEGTESEQVRPDLDDLADGSKYRGRLEYFSPENITGWCLLASNPRATVRLELYCNGVLTSSTSTGVLRPDLSDHLGFESLAGFCFPLDLETRTMLLTDGGSNLETCVSVRVEKSGEELPQGPHFHLDRIALAFAPTQAVLSKPPVPLQLEDRVPVEVTREDYESGIRSDLINMAEGPAYRGSVEFFSTDAIAGWCVLAADPSTTVQLELYFDDEWVATASTGLPRPDIAEALGPDVRAGFSFPLNEAAQDALLKIHRERKHRGANLADLISVRVKGTQETLPASAELCLDRTDLINAKILPTTSSLVDLDKEPPYRGWLDSYRDEVISGWCISARNPLEEVNLEVYVSDVLVATLGTSVYRSDLSRTLGFPVKAGFEFRMNETASKSILEALETLEIASRDTANLDRLITVRVKGIPLRLPVGPHFHLSVADIERLIESLEERLQTARLHRSTEHDAPIAPAKPTLNVDAGVGVIAFYLPQFHPFAENNRWWGEGFTDWTNVSSAKRSFPSHYQPRLPADLGYYDLRLGSVQAAQVELAKKYGVSAFCYHYYWFSGTTLMTMPIERHVKENYDVDFCLCWANENWSRRWDGSENEVLIAQEHSEADDVAFINSVIPYFKHPRYLKMNGAPLLIVYRVSLLSNAERVIRLWKEAAREAGFPDLHVCMAETFGLSDPREYGADSTVEFPPHGVQASERMQDIDGLAAGFNGKVYAYADAAASALARPDASFMRFNTVMPSWDNTSRKGLGAHIFHNATPELFEAWLTSAIAKTRANKPPGYRYVFINAWNEWAEGAYLEPDRIHGHAYLRAVRNALSPTNEVLGEAVLPTSNVEETLFRERVNRVVSTLANANAQLANIVVTRSFEDLPSPFIEPAGTSIGTIAETTLGRMHVEKVNGRQVSREVTVLQSQNLGLTGWLYAPEALHSKQRPAFICLTSLALGNTNFVASIYELAERPQEAVPRWEEQFYGFSFVGDLTKVPAGSYRVAALIATGNDPTSLVCVNSDLVVHVG